MNAVNFPESNVKLGPPDSMPEVRAISAWRGIDHDGQPLVVTCWRLTDDELSEVHARGVVWLSVCGRTMPPVTVLGVSPFQELPPSVVAPPVECEVADLRAEVQRLRSYLAMLWDTGARVQGREVLVPIADLGLTLEQRRALAARLGTAIERGECDRDGAAPKAAPRRRRSDPPAEGGAHGG